MMPNEEKLQRLLSAAAKAPSEIPTAAPGLETRVLANWRAGRADDESAWLFAFFRHAIVGASLVLVLSAAWSLSRATVAGPGDEAALLDYDIQMSLNP
ncbi:MAG: hypothetical protein NT154_35720 [Verrucomicrobia bacterium]|nr:hypothetical protein [Verrucomicrobiota bacterium]